MWTRIVHFDCSSFVSHYGCVRYVWSVCRRANITSSFLSVQDICFHLPTDLTENCVYLSCWFSSVAIYHECNILFYFLGAYKGSWHYYQRFRFGQAMQLYLFALYVLFLCNLRSTSLLLDNESSFRRNFTRCWFYYLLFLL